MFGDGLFVLGGPGGRGAPFDLDDRDDGPRVDLIFGLGEDFLQDARHVRFDLDGGLVGFDLEQRLATLDRLSDFDEPLCYLDLALGGCEVGHFHFDLH
ncbi:MAG: hypothetical protein HQ592_16995 [Planctomycetes bacterium]|nr:hypothetical protein [Planctomycetota bacterium]